MKPVTRVLFNSGILLVFLLMAMGGLQAEPKKKKKVKVKTETTEPVAAVGSGLQDPTQRSAWSLSSAARWQGDRVVLTPCESNLVGAMWSQQPIDLSQDFEARFRVNLGSKDEDGADGLAVVFATETAAAEVGHGLGYQGLAPSFAVELDTYPNDGEHLGDDLGDPLADHIALNAGGQANHRTSGLPVKTLPNIEDGKEHLLIVRWRAEPRIVEVYFDNDSKPLLTYKKDIVAAYLGGQKLVRFGVTASTGEHANTQVVVPLPNPGKPMTGALVDMRCKLQTAGSAKVKGEVVRLTPDEGDQAGAVWCDQRLDLGRDLLLEAELAFGTKDDDGADGIVLVLAPEISAAEVGHGLGYQGIAPSFAVELDTYPNDGEHLGDDLGDPISDHLAFVAGGQADHKKSGLPVATLKNLEDGKRHALRVRWTAASHSLEVFLDGSPQPILALSRDIVARHLDGKAKVRFGFTASTGAHTNVHEVRFVRVAQTPGPASPTR